jgi:hypothetical protein
MRLTKRGRIVIWVLGLVLVAAPAAVWFASRGDLLVRPDDPCTQPPPLVTAQGVTLQPNAMTAFKHAETIAGRSIPLVQSYRSCAQQAEACKNICGNANGCPGRCVKPGHSYHQLGAAIDVSADTLAIATW